MSGQLFAAMRHAPTDWNARGLLQGLTDTPLSAEGIALARCWRVPAPATSWPRVSSPLVRARHTAELIGPTAPVAIDSRLREMSFGAWEGRTLADLRRDGGEAFFANELRGLDFTPPGGESPRHAMVRVASWLDDHARADAPVLVVAHKAVLRTLLALATGWDMTDKPPVRFQRAAIHLFRALPGGGVSLERANIPMETDRAAA